MKSCLRSVVVGMVVGLGLLGLARDGRCEEAASPPPDMPEMPGPTAEHAWLEQLAGRWTTNCRCNLDPANPMTCSGHETSRMLGGFWLRTEVVNSLAGQEMTGIMTVGYDPAAKKYVGTWVDSMTSHLWRYEGTVDAAGKVLTLEAVGPRMDDPTKTANYRDVLTIVDADHRTLTSYIEAEPGQWTKMMEMKAERAK